MMKYYFSLQVKLTKRLLAENGISLLGAALVAMGLFIGFSIVWFHQTEKYSTSYALLPLTILPLLSSQNRNESLKIMFSNRDYRKVRLVENLLISIPFQLFLISKGLYIWSIIPIILSFIWSFIQVDGWNIRAIPTPFARIPFEFSSGFRKSFWVILLIYLMAGIGMYVQNYNLILVSLAALFLCCISFYGTAEGEYFVWIFSASPHKFLCKKMNAALIGTTVIVAPLIVASMFFSPLHTTILITTIIVGYGVVIISLLGKYASYPSQFNLAQMMAIAFSIILFPLIILILPLLFRKAKQKLQSLLP